MPPNDKVELVKLLRQYKNVFAWLFEEMKGLDPTLCEHQINLIKDAKTGSTTPISNESQSRSLRKRGDQQTIKGRVHLTSKEGYLV